MSRAAFIPIAKEIDPLDYRSEVFSLARKEANQKSLILFALDSLESELKEEAIVPFIDLPLAVHAAITGKAEPALPLAAATTLLFLGIDLLDDLADGDLPDRFKKFGLTQVQLAGLTLISSLPQLMVARLPIPPSLRGKMLSDLAGGLLQMSEGQHF